MPLLERFEESVIVYLTVGPVRILSHVIAHRTITITAHNFCGARQHGRARLVDADCSSPHDHRARAGVCDIPPTTPSATWA